MSLLINKFSQRLLSLAWLFNIIGLKTIFTVIYIVFSFFIVKKLEVIEYGIYSYILALIVYFSTIPLLGLPVYLQRSVAKNQGIHCKYFIITFCFAIAGFVIAYQALPNLSLQHKIGILFIICSNCLIMILVSIHDGFSRYTFQYKLLFISSAWMFVSIIKAFFTQNSLTLATLLDYWMINSWIIIVISIVILKKLYNRIANIHPTLNKSVHLIIIDLLLVYSVSVPDAFARFYDRYLATKYINDNFLGNYSFNLMAITTVYALFIRPINSVLVTELAKTHTSVNTSVKVIKKYYCYGLPIYFFCYLLYIPLSDRLLIFFGLYKYIGTINIFKICFINSVLYFLSIPFANLITLSDNKKEKLIYCFSSLAIFNIPLLFLSIEHTQKLFFIGFIVANLFNLGLCLSFKYNYAYDLLLSIYHDISRVTNFKKLDVKYKG